MKVTYTPDGSAPQIFEFDPEETRESRLEVLEKAYARLAGEKLASIDAMILNVMYGQASARRVLLWHLISEVHPKVRIEDIDPLRRELVVEASRADLLWLRSRFETTAGMSDANRQELIAGIDAQLADMAQDDAEGKAPSPASAGGTGEP